MCEKVSLQNKYVSIDFDTDFNNFISIIDKQTQINVLGNIDKRSNQIKSSPPLFELDFVYSDGELTLGELPKASYVMESDNKLILTWNHVQLLKSSNIPLSTYVNISMSVLLEDSSSTAELSLSFQVSDGEPVGIRDIKLSINADFGSSASTSQLFFPQGFGYIYSNPQSSTGGAISEAYPSGNAAFQFMSLSSSSSSPSALYFSALDSTASPKLFQYSTIARYQQVRVFDTQSSATHNVRNGAEMTPVDKHSLPTWNTNPASDLTSASATASALSIVAYPTDAGKPLGPFTKWSMPYPVSVGVVSNIDPVNSRPLWFEASMIYREWALKNAEWTKKGPLSSRPETLSNSLRNNNLWFNSHWQCHDIFNTTGGEPSFVSSYTSTVADRIDEPNLALHWYEWQQGPDPNPESRYLFDTHYPDYFPPRNSFEKSVLELQQRNISIYPYINGRIFDIHSDSYLVNNGAQYCSKLAPEKLITDDVLNNELVTYQETYGSNATFCVSSPFTTYWQDKIADIVDELVTTYNVYGVYIDQIGAAIPKLCWDQNHGHTLGGGTYWRQGYAGMLEAITKKLQASQKKSGPLAPMVTEDNAEYAIDFIQGFLTLNAFRGALAQSSTGTQSTYKHSVNAFPAIYGGYYIGFGAEWFRTDFQDHDWFCGKLSKHFAAGSQLGWFSLAGIANDPQDSCGPMGVGDLLLAPENNDLIAFLQVLLSARRHVLLDYFVDGHLVRLPVLSPEPPAVMQTVSGGGRPLLDYDSVVQGAWKSDRIKSVLFFLIGTTSTEYETTVTMDLALWSLGTGSQYIIETLSSTGSVTSRQHVSGDGMSFLVTVPPRGILLYKFSCI